jgi:Rrf2 family transcriptional regulator, cysteine metabolism repressor
MKLSTKVRYGVKSLFELAMHEGTGPVSLKLIADRQGLSEHYLEQLAAPLRKSGLIQSVRGAQGGYALARPAGQITIGDVIRALEGPIDDGPVEGEREAGGFNPWNVVRGRLAGLVDSITLEELVEQAKQELASHNLYFQI